MNKILGKIFRKLKEIIDSANNKHTEKYKSSCKGQRKVQNLRKESIENVSDKVI